MLCFQMYLPGVHVSMALVWVQDENNEFKALPYEAAGAMVRSLMLHCHKLQLWIQALEDLLIEDPEMKKAATKKMAERVGSNKHVKRFLVFNRRTG